MRITEANPLSTAEKDIIMRRLRDNEERIIQARKDISAATEVTVQFGTYAENVAAYASRLNGLLLERAGFCQALSILGVCIMWEGEHPTDIFYDT